VDADLENLAGRIAAAPAATVLDGSDAVFPKGPRQKKRQARTAKVLIGTVDTTNKEKLSALDLSKL
jgi:hypothetical protein